MRAALSLILLAVLPQAIAAQRPQGRTLRRKPQGTTTPWWKY